MYTTPADSGNYRTDADRSVFPSGKSNRPFDNRGIVYSEMPEEYIFPGSVLPISDAAPIQELPENERQEIQRLCCDILARYRFDWEVSHHEEKL